MKIILSIGLILAMCAQPIIYNVIGLIILAVVVLKSKEFREDRNEFSN